MPVAPAWRAWPSVTGSSGPNQRQVSFMRRMPTPRKIERQASCHTTLLKSYIDIAADRHKEIFSERKTRVTGRKGELPSKLIHQDLLFPAEPGVRSIARGLYERVANLPIVSPHGHTDPRWYALNEPFPDPARLLIVPDHYIYRMLFSQGVRLEDLGVSRLDGTPVETDGRAIWRRFAE